MIKENTESNIDKPKNVLRFGEPKTYGSNSSPHNPRWTLPRVQYTLPEPMYT